MNKSAYGPAALQSQVGTLHSRMGGFFPGSHVIFRGKDLHTELKDMDWLELFVFGITGRRFSPPQLRLMHAIWTYTSYPDSRIWNNRVAALAGSARSTATLGVAAALAISEASIYGRGIDIRAIDFLHRAKQHQGAGGQLDELVRQELRSQRSIAGYGRPLVAKDERIEPLLSLARQLQLDQGPYLQLAFAVDNTLTHGRWRQQMNYGGLAAAIAADLGFTAKEYVLFSFPAFLAGMLPCFIDSAERTEGSLFPLSCNHIDYRGHPQRSWPPRKAS